MHWATWGYGVHVLASASGRPSALPAHDQAFGLKLGWLPDDLFQSTPGSFVERSVENATQVLLFTDGLLGEDHVAPARTWRWLEETNDLAPTISAPKVLPWLLDRSDIRGDDVTAAVLHVT